MMKKIPVSRETGEENKKKKVSRETWTDKKVKKTKGGRKKGVFSFLSATDVL